MTAEPDYGLLDRAGLGAVAFYPRADHTPPPPGASDTSFEVGEGVRLGARFYAAQRDAPTIVYFHGNGEVASDHDGIAPFYRGIGLNLLVVEFRGYGTSSGRPSFASLIADAREVAGQAPRFLDERGFRGRRFVMGRSMGANPAIEIAANRPDGFEGLILESGAGNARRWVERVPKDAEAAAQLADAHEAKIRSIRMPALILHGALDELVPVESAYEMAELLAPNEPELIVIPDAGHNDIFWTGHEAYLAAIRRFAGAQA